MVILEKTTENDTEPPEPILKEVSENENTQEIIENTPEIQENTPEIQEPIEPKKKRGRPKKIKPEPPPSPVPSPAPAPVFDQNAYNQQLLRALMDHNRTSILRREERWRNLVKF